MKILVSAIACNPFGHSEGSIGWKAVSAIAKNHQVWVITIPEARTSIEKARAEGLVSENLHFVYHGPTTSTWNPGKIFGRLLGWWEYVRWSQTILEVAQKVHAVEKFDLAHHITYSTWRVPSPLWKLGIPFVWGPVGGTDSMPLRFFKILSFKAKLFECVRFMVQFGKFSPALKLCLANSSVVLAPSQSAKRFLLKIANIQDKIDILCPAIFTARELARSYPEFEKDCDTQVFRLYSGGSIIGSKGLYLVLHALKRLTEENIPFSYVISGGGPEIDFLKATAKRLGIRDKIQFFSNLSGADYLEQLRKAHVCILPSFRENIGLTTMDAMLHKCVPIIADSGAPAEIVQSRCGYKIPVGSPDQMIHDMASVLSALSKSPETIHTTGNAARERILQNYSEESYIQKIELIYKALPYSQNHD